MNMREKIIRRVELLIDTHCAKCETQLAGDPEEIADAVLDALMTPDEGMIEAGAKAWTFHNGCDEPYEREISDIWQAMLTAARTPAEEK